MLKKRDRWYKLVKSEPWNEIRRQQYKLFNQEVKKKIRKAKQNYYKESFLSNDQRTIWQSLNRIISNNGSNKTPPIKYLNINGIKIENPFQITEELNDFFINVGRNLAAQIPKIQITNNNEYFNEINDQSMFLDIENITEDEVESMIDEMNPKKASGFDLISVKVVKNLKYYLIPILKHLLIISLKSHSFPEKLKIAKITPIYKSDHHFICSNYRPISVLPVFSKILEKFVHKKMSQFLELKKLLRFS